jgi:hypothetical protein
MFQSFILHWIFPKRTYQIQNRLLFLTSLFLLAISLCVIAKVNILRYQGECEEEISPLLKHHPHPPKRRKKNRKSDDMLWWSEEEKSYTRNSSNRGRERKMPIMGLQIKCPPQFNLIHTTQKEVYEAKREARDGGATMMKKCEEKLSSNITHNLMA